MQIFTLEFRSTTSIMWPPTGGVVSITKGLETVKEDSPAPFVA